MTMPIHHLLSLLLQQFHPRCPPSISIEFTISQRPLKKADGGSNGLGMSTFLYSAVLVHPDPVNRSFLSWFMYKVMMLAKEIHGKVEEVVMLVPRVDGGIHIWTETDFGLDRDGADLFTDGWPE